MIHPDGHSEVILAVPKYGFNWQTDYAFAVPLRVPKGSTLKSIAHYDNSRQNKANPDPTQPVYYGDQTWEEMSVHRTAVQRRQGSADYDGAAALSCGG